MNPKLKFGPKGTNPKNRAEAVTDALGGDHIPVRRHGGVYCSKKCGAGCTVAMYNAAVREGETLVRQLGAGWTARTTENAGWHVDALSPNKRVRVTKHGTEYTAWLLLVEGDAGATHTFDCSTPRGAVEALFTFVNDLATAVERV